MAKTFYIVIDNYGLPCSYPVSKKTAENLAIALNKKSDCAWRYAVKKVDA